MQLITMPSSNSSKCHYFTCDPATDYLSHVLYSADEIILATSLVLNHQGKYKLSEFFESPDQYKVLIPHFEGPLTMEFLQQNHPELLL